MSVWTHVNGCMRIDGLPFLEECSESYIRRILGTPSVYPAQTADGIPCGSEGSIQYELLRVGDGFVMWTVPIWGDLRDFGLEDVKAIEDWVEKIFLSPIGKFIRSFILEIEVEGYPPKIMRLSNEATEEKTPIWS